MTSQRFCNCSTPEPEQVGGGIRLCAECGEQIGGSRDQILVAIARGVAALDRRLARIEANGVGSGSSNGAASAGLIGTREAAGRLGFSEAWVRDHAEELGVIRMGAGPKPRLMFDAAIVDAEGEGAEARRQIAASDQAISA